MSTILDSPEQVAKMTSKVLTGLVAVVVVVSLISSFSVIAPGNTGVIFNIWTGAPVGSAGHGVADALDYAGPKLSDRAPDLHHGSAVGRGLRHRRRQYRSSHARRSAHHPGHFGDVQHVRGQGRPGVQVVQGLDISEIEATFIRRTIITVAQNAAGQMSLSEVISSKRDELQGAIQKSLSAELNKMGFALDKVNLGASHLPQILEAQMQQKMAAQQQAQQAEYELQKQEMLAKAAVAKAEGEAQSVWFAPRPNPKPIACCSRR